MKLFELLNLELLACIHEDSHNCSALLRISMLRIIIVESKRV
jgi:hypothetical protein